MFEFHDTLASNWTINARQIIVMSDIMLCMREYGSLCYPVRDLSH